MSNHEGRIVAVVPRRGTVNRAATTHTGRLAAVTIKRGTVTRLATTHTGRAAAVTIKRGTATRLATTHTGRKPASAAVQGVRNRTRVFLEIGDDPAHKITLRWSAKYQAYELMRATNREDVIRVPGAEPTSGQHLTLTAKWSGSLLGLRINGSPFVTVPVSFVPAILSSVMVVGGDLSGNSQDGASNVWLVTGPGTPSDSDVAMLEALGDTVPGYGDIDEAAGAELIWPGGSGLLGEWEWGSFEWE